jgi:hypothetical protein
VIVSPRGSWTFSNEIGSLDGERPCNQIVCNGRRRWPVWKREAPLAASERREAPPAASGRREAALAGLEEGTAAASRWEELRRGRERRRVDTRVGSRRLEGKEERARGLGADGSGLELFGAMLK